MFKRVAKRIIRFFTDIYSNDIGTYDPKAEKIGARGVLYWVIGIILCFLIPAALVYIEVGEFDWNVFRFLWGEEETAGLHTKGLFRLGSYIFTLSGNGFLLISGYISPYRINGHSERLQIKEFTRCLKVLETLGLVVQVYVSDTSSSVVDLYERYMPNIKYLKFIKFKENQNV